MFSSRDQHTSYKSRNNTAPKNTILHDLILENDVTAALSVIEADSADHDGKSIVNALSLGNTALLLALKCGAIKIAEALLKHPKIKIDLPDCRGLTALHWACMLRQDNIIELLLEKGANPHHATKRWAGEFLGCDELHPITPLKLYMEPIDPMPFYHYYTAAKIATKCNEGGLTYFEKHDPLFLNCFFKITKYDKPEYLPPFCDQPHLHIPGAIAYTDTLFHMREICTNMGWMLATTEFVTQQQMPRSMDMFRVNFIEGMFAFCKFRNERPVSENLLTRMQPPHNAVIATAADAAVTQASTNSQATLGYSH